MRGLSGRFLRNHVMPDSGRGLVRKSPHGKHAGNLWSGYEMGTTGKIVGASGALGMGVYWNRDLQSEIDESKKLRDVRGIQSTPLSRADHDAYQQASNQPIEHNIDEFGELSGQTNGDLVFAMHHLRHGG